MAQVFSCEFCQISKNTFFIEHLQATASIFEDTLKEIKKRVFMLDKLKYISLKNLLMFTWDVI